jgi:RimJ/RimL family protein N-acetyltransferase
MVIIREAVKEDAEQLLAHSKHIIETSPFMVSSPEEFSFSIEQEERWIEEQRKTGGAVFVAEENGKVVGMLNFRVTPRKKLLHHGLTGISIREEYCNQGLGTKLMETLIAWAKEQPSIEMLCLEVLSTNDWAIHVYKKLGFQEEGRRVDHIKQLDGTYVDDILMYLKVK